MTTEIISPRNIEAEQVLLGSIFLDNGLIDDLAERVPTPSYFYKTKHRHIFQAMLDLRHHNKEIDWITVSDQLRAKGELEDAGGLEYLEVITESTPSTAGAEQYAEIVQNKALKRFMLQKAHEMIAAAQDDTKDLAEVIEEMEAAVMTIGEARHVTSARNVGQILTEVMEKVSTFRAMRHGDGSAISGVPSGFAHLDRLKLGFEPGELIIVAGRPGHGKSAIALNMADYAARDMCKRKKDGAILFFSLEMEDTELMSRLVCARSNTDIRDIKSGNISPEREKELESHCKEIEAENRLYIDSPRYFGMSELRAKVRRLARRTPIALVIIDYLQLMDTSKGLDRHLALGEVSRALKMFAKEMQLPIMALAQLNRKVEERAGGRPMLSDLRESGSLEQDADAVLFITRPDMGKGQDEGETERATLLLAKNRNGPTGEVFLQFRKHCARFESATGQYSTPDVAPARKDWHESEKD